MRARATVGSNFYIARISQFSKIFQFHVFATIFQSFAILSVFEQPGDKYTGARVKSVPQCGCNLVGYISNQHSRQPAVLIAFSNFCIQTQQLLEKFILRCTGLTIGFCKFLFIQTLIACFTIFLKGLLFLITNVGEIHELLTLCML